MTFLAGYWFFRFGAVRRFTHDTGHFTLVSLFMVIVFKTPFTEMIRRKEALYSGNRTVIAIIDQVEEDERFLIGTRTRDKFIT